MDASSVRYLMPVKAAFPRQRHWREKLREFAPRSPHSRIQGEEQHLPVITSGAERNSGDERSLPKFVLGSSKCSHSLRAKASQGSICVSGALSFGMPSGFWY